MSILLGVDTGGTYTDAVLLRGEDEVIATSKALTTRDDLSRGIGEAVAAVLTESGTSGSDVSLASLSTTLATNALVEDQGERVALIAVGFDPRDLERQGLSAAMKGDPVINIGGGHSHAGAEVAALDLAALDEGLDGLGKGVAAFAVASQFATRNPDHEVRVRDHLRERTGLPVSCSHDLSARLNGPKRALTAVLNARLIGMIDRLIEACETRLRDHGIDAPLMVVRGDAALVSADYAREKPIETILSGPAASIVGAGWLTGRADAVVSDIGGTTTDIAILKDGRPQIDPLGARVGGFRTMVEAVAMRTYGLGGDSQVHMEPGGLAGSIRLGPRRVIPVALAAYMHPDVILPALEAQSETERRGEFDGRFAVATGVRPASSLDPREARVFERLDGGAAALDRLLSSRLDLSALDRLISRGLVMGCGITPSDAAHALGLLDAWDAHAARLALDLFGRQRTGAGRALAEGADAMARLIVAQLTRQTAECILAAAIAQDVSPDVCPDPEAAARHWLIRHAQEGAQSVLHLRAGLRLPLIGLGASAPTWYGAVADRLGCEAVLPVHAGVANAIGAVVGKVSVSERGTVTSPAEGVFRVHLGDGPRDFGDEATALAALETQLEAQARQGAAMAGAVAVRLQTDRDIRASEIEGRRVFIEAEIVVTASGRPRVA